MDTTETTSPKSEITALLRAWKNGDSNAPDKLIPLVYRRLYNTAQHYMALEAPGHILGNTALVNETYLQLAKMRNVDWQDRGHFFATCAQLMRNILTNYARSRLFQKRGGLGTTNTFDENREDHHNSNAQIIAIDDALRDLATHNERMSRIVQLRLFVGLSVDETAEALGISDRTVRREWQSAKVWLLREMDRGKRSGK
ncbi:MAG: ECF-type sigma factor [Terriglobales bacterium]|jgi:RNA polymerase sigma factor (TIGR02999 family)